MNDVLFSKDLDFMDLPKLPFCVFGCPINHSLSPIMQNKALEFLGLSDEAKYYKFEIPSENLLSDISKFIDKNFKGINLTIPLKEEILSRLDWQDEFSKKCGACNTIKISDGKLYGYNTDGFGLENALKVNFGKSFWKENILIYGAGGAAKAAAFAAAFAGAKKVFIANRTIEKAEDLASQIRAENFNSSVFDEKWASKISIIVNATSIGLKEGDPSVCDFSIFNKEAVFCDMVYAKNREVESCVNAKENGIRACSGISMLAWQGAKSLQIWLGFDDEVLFKVGKIMQKTLEEIINGI